MLILGASLGLAALVAPIVLIVLFYWASFRLGRFIRRRRTEFAATKDSSGRAADLTLAARYGMTLMPEHDAILARAGTNKAAPSSLGTTTMRPAWGFRLQTLATIPLVGAVLVTPMFDEIVLRDLFGTGPVPMLKESIFAFTVLTAITANLQEVRYDQDRVIMQKALGRRREFSWRDLIGLKDDGNSTFILTLRDGPKLRLPKHLVGVQDFLSLAHHHMDRNTAQAA